MPVYKHNVLKWRKTNKFSIGCLICAVPCLMDRKIYNFIGAFLGHGGFLVMVVSLVCMINAREKKRRMHMTFEATL